MRLISSPFSFRGRSILGSIYRPYIQILVTSSKIQKWIPVEMIVDTGADYCLFPKKYTNLLNINLEKDCFSERTHGVGGVGKVFLLKSGVKVKLRQWEKEIPVGFLDRDDVPALLGRLECLELLQLEMKYRITILAQ